MIYKSVLFRALFLGVFLGVASLMAEEVAAPAARLSVRLTPHLPSMYINKILFSQESYTQGETIAGSFNLCNLSANATGEISCLVSLVRLDPEGHVAVLLYDRRQTGKFNIEGKTTRKIDFQYPITFVPKDDNLGLHIRAVSSNGTSLAWAVKRLKIAGGSVMLEPREAYVEVNGKEKFGLQIGPQIGESDVITFNVELENTTGGALTLTPVIALTDLNQHVILPSQKGEAVTLKASEMKTLRLALPIKHLKPQTCLAKIVFLDGEGRLRTGYFFARYIIAGDIVAISRVLTNVKLPVEKPQDVDLAIGFTGKPADPTRPSANSQSPVIADLKVTLFNENKEAVGEATLKEMHFGMVGDVQLLVKTTLPATALRATVVVLKSGEEIARFDGPVIQDKEGIVKPSAPPVAVAAVPQARKDFHEAPSWVLPVAVASGILAILGVGLYFMKKRRDL